MAGEDHRWGSARRRAMLAVLVVVIILAGVATYGSLRGWRSGDAEALCSRHAQESIFAGDVDVNSVKYKESSYYHVSGTITREGSEPVAFDCIARSDLHGGLGGRDGRHADEMVEMQSVYSRRRLPSLLLGTGIILMTTGCSDPQPVTVEEAREATSQMILELQTAMLPDVEVIWTKAKASEPRQAEGACRWSPGDSTVSQTIPEDDPDWGDRRVRVNEVLRAFDYPEVGDAERRRGAPAFGFSCRRDDGASVSLYTASGKTVIRVAGIPVTGCEG